MNVVDCQRYIKDVKITRAVQETAGTCQTLFNNILSLKIERSAVQVEINNPVVNSFFRQLWVLWICLIIAIFNEIESIKGQK